MGEGRTAQRLTSCWKEAWGGPEAATPTRRAGSDQLWHQTGFLVQFQTIQESGRAQNPQYIPSPSAAQPREAERSSDLEGGLSPPTRANQSCEATDTQGAWRRCWDEWNQCIFLHMPMEEWMDG